MLKRLLVALLLSLGIPVAAWAQNTNTLPPACTAATLLTNCVPQVEGVRARVINAASATVCTGTGSVVNVCVFDGSSWVVSEVAGTTSITGTTSDTFTVDSDGDSSGTAAFVFGEFGESFASATDNVIDIIRNDAGVVSLRGSDDSSPVGGFNIFPNGAAAMGLGVTNITTRIDLFTEGMDVRVDDAGNTLSLRNSASTGNVDLDFRDYGDTTDDDMAHVLMSANCTTTSTGAEDCDLTISVTEDGSNRTAITFDGDGDVIVPNNSLTATFGAPNGMTAVPNNRTQIVGIPKLNVTHTGALANGTTSVAVANPLLANCNAVVNGTETDDGTFFMTGSTSYKYVWPGTVAADDGIDCVIAYPAVTDPVSFGFWFRSDTAITSGDIDINFNDGAATDGTFSTFATTVVDEWQWVELNITTACSGVCSEIDGIEFLATAQAAAGTALDGVEMYIDQIAMWKAADETAIGDIQVGGLIDFAFAPTAAGSANTMTEGTEWTNYFINYQAGADAIIPITDLSANYGTTLEALE